MAVLTPIDDASALALVSAYGLGEPWSLRGIPAGSVNSNFALDAAGERFFLRVYEEQDPAGARAETAMLTRLAAAGVPTPAPRARLDGSLVSLVRGKAAALFPWLAGTMRCQASVTETDARLMGEALARVHVEGAALAAATGRFNFVDLSKRLARIEASGDAQFAPLVPSLQRALEQAHRERDPELASGLIHSDLFRDNVLWRADGQIAALLDFESACQGTYAYDLMVTVLAWCVGDDLDMRLARAMCAGYESLRPLSARERRGLRAEGCFGALRFTITRITDYAMRTSVDGPRVVKDWRRFFMRYERIAALPDAWL
jgi:homoserine kinase type II